MHACVYQFNLLPFFEYFAVQSVIIRLKTGLQVGNQKTLIAGFIKWRDYTRSYAQFREATLEKHFAQVSQKHCTPESGRCDHY